MTIAISASKNNYHITKDSLKALCFDSKVVFNLNIIAYVLNFNMSLY